MSVALGAHGEGRAWRRCGEPRRGGGAMTAALWFMGIPAARAAARHGAEEAR
jgi:hypothetical protein